MKIDLDAIERVAGLAQERSPGPWRRVHLAGGGMREPRADESTDYIYDSAPKPEGFDDYDGGTWDGNRVVETDGGFYEPKGVTIEHIAQCSPDVVLALVARIRELEQRLEPSRLQQLLEMRLLDASDFPYAASKELIAEVVEAIAFPAAIGKAKEQGR